MTLSRPWFWLFAIFCALIALLSGRILALPLAVAMPHMAHYLPVLPAPMWGHLIFGPLALICAPLQLWTGLRGRFRMLHRVSGYVYGFSVLVAGTTSLLLLPQFQGTLWAALGFTCLGVLWLACTAFGIAHAMRGNTARHRVWMLRSIALTFAAVTLRLYMAPLMATGWTVVETYNITAWAAWVPNLWLANRWTRRSLLTV